jgi:hypothetical protein
MRECGQKVEEQDGECKFCPLFAAGTAFATQPSELAGENFRRAEPRESALNEVNPNKCREKKPPLADKENEQHAHKDNRPSQNPNELIDIHRFSPFVLFMSINTYS